MQVLKVMTKSAICCSSGDSLEDAAQIMWEKDFGSVPVVDDEHRIRGMLTDRDISMAAYTSGRALESLSVGDAMSSDVRCCQATDHINDVLDSMDAAQIHRLPVVDADDRVVGMLTVADVLQALGAGESKSRRKLSDKLIDTLVSVTRPRRLGEEVESVLEPTRRGGRKAALQSRGSSARG